MGYYEQKSKSLIESWALIPGEINHSNFAVVRDWTQYLLNILN